MLKNSKFLIWKYMEKKYKTVLGYDLMIKIFNKIVSNSHVGSDPIGSGIYIITS